MQFSRIHANSERREAKTTLSLTHTHLLSTASTCLVHFSIVPQIYTYAFIYGEKYMKIIHKLNEHTQASSHTIICAERDVRMCFNMRCTCIWITILTRKSMAGRRIVAFSPPSQWRLTQVWVDWLCFYSRLDRLLCFKRPLSLQDEMY